MLAIFTGIQDATPMQWGGRVISALVILFLLFDAAIKLMDLEVVRKSYVELGYPQSVGLAIGLIVLGCALLYAFPRTSVLGAVLITALCGGAVASQLRIGSPMASHVLFGVYIGVMAWAGLWLRNDSLRSMLPMVQSAN